MQTETRTHPSHVFDASEAGAVLRSATKAARSYLAELNSLPAKEPGADAASEWKTQLPEVGMGAEAAVNFLAKYVRDAAVHVDGPRFFHLVAGGSTPAAMGEDIDANAC